MKISLIAAVSDNDVIGKQGKLPWHLPADLKHFREITNGHPVIMGRKTFESVGRPLPHRRNIVISKTLRSGEGYEVVPSLVDGLWKFLGYEGEVFVIGGGGFFEEAMRPIRIPNEGEEVMKVADTIYLTRVHTTCEGDTFFPAVEESEWVEVAREHHDADQENPYPYTFLTYEHRNRTT